MAEHDGAVHTPHFVLTSAGELQGEDTPENREIIRRIQACISACEGLTLSELENGIVADMRRVIGQVVPVLEEKKRLEEWVSRQLASTEAESGLIDIAASDAATSDRIG